LTRSILIILQLLIVVILAFTLANPVISRATTGEGEIIIVLDASAAMSAREGASSRFDRALSEIMDIAQNASDSRPVTIIIANDDPQFLGTPRMTTESEITNALSDITYFLGSGDITEALSMAIGVQEQNPDAQIILFTSRYHSSAQNITVRNMCNGEWNAAILDFFAENVDGHYRLVAFVASFNQDIELPLILEIDGNITDIRNIALSGNEVDEVVFGYPDLRLGGFEEARIFFDFDGIGEDSFEYDNSFVLYRAGRRNVRVQLVGIAPHTHFLNLMLHAENVHVSLASRLWAGDETPTSIDDFGFSMTGYDIYIFVDFMPHTMPTDGAVWLINPNIAPLGSNLVLGPEFMVDRYTPLSAGPQSATFRQLMHGQTLTENIDASNITASRYRQIIASPGFETIMTVNDHPALLARRGDADNFSTTVFSFGFQNSNISLRFLELSVLINNLINFSVTETLSQHLFEVGQSVTLNARVGVSELVISNSRGDVTFVNVGSGIVFETTTPGDHTVTAIFGDGSYITDNFFVRVPESEINFGRTGDAISAPTGNGGIIGGLFEYVDILIFLIALFLIIYIMEWWLQYREQF